MKIDFKTKKTEAEWQRAIDRFWLALTPRWFEWLSWITILGVITFLAEKTNSSAMNLIKIISYIALFMYFQSFFFKFELENIPGIQSAGIARLISLLISGSLAVGVWLLLQFAICKLRTVYG